jgi:hypothetical protein
MVWNEGARKAVLRDLEAIIEKLLALSNDSWFNIDYNHPIFLRKRMCSKKSTGTLHFY